MNSEDVRRQWAGQSGEFSPEYYAYYGPNETSETIGDVLERYVDRDAAVLELGCSSGRHLAHLRERGFENLAGLDVNADAFDVLADAYPDLAAEGTFYHDAIERAVPDFADGRFDVVYSVETLQHLHPEADGVLEELPRIADELLVTAEIEGEESGSSEPDVSYVNDEFPLYHRDWNRVFTGMGLLEVETESGKRDTIRAFRVPRE